MKKRIIGAILILAIGIPILFLGGIYFTIFSVLVAALALKELMELKKHHKQIPNGMFFLSILNLSFLIFEQIFSKIPSLDINPQYMAFTFIILFLPCLFYKKEKYTTHEAMYLYGSILFLTLVCKGILVLRFFNVWILVYLIFIAVFTDTFAYLIGRAIGKHKCSPTISPNKTWEGCIGGSIMGVLLSSIFYLFKIGDLSILKILLLSTILSIIGQFGDLVFSKIKRENEIKDFSSLIPGHGGILDRIDSLLFIVLCYISIIGLF